MVNLLIKDKIIEIFTVIIIVILSIPFWQSFDNKISNANVTTLDDYKIDFELYNTNKLDRIVVSNEHNINKNYKIYLIIDQELNTKNTSININNKYYNLNDFYLEKEQNRYVYTLVDDYIVANTTSYEINISRNISNYWYVFEENTNLLNCKSKF